MNMIAIMSNEILAFLRPKAVAHRSFERNEHLFHRGDPVQVIFVVIGGCANLIRYQEHGSPAILQRATPGTVLAEASLFAEHYHCDAIAATAMEAVAVPIGEVRRLLSDDRVFALEWTRHLSRELQSARKRAEIISLRTVGARLDAWLIWNDGELPTKGEWRRMAEEIAVSPEALYREISRRRG
jgi:CRP-like cAMP-binding protein